MYPAQWDRLGFTSGRRTYAGNRKVGGVPNSDHLDGTAADFTASPAQIRAVLGPNVRILDEHDHRHVSGLSNVPYHGKNGILGLVNGVDTSAPKGGAMISPRKPTPQTLSSFTDKPMTLQDLAEKNPILGADQPLGISQLPALTDGMTLADMTQQTGLPPAKKNNTGAILRGILGALSDGALAYAGRAPIFAPAMAREADAEQERNQFAERLAATAQMKREERMAKAAEPPQWFQDADWFNRLDPSKKAMVTGYRDAMYPVLADYVDAQGNTRKGVYSRSSQGFAGMGGGPREGEEVDGYIYLGGDPNDANSWRAK